MSKSKNVRRQLLELQHFILRPKSADVRIDLYGQMITRALTDHGKSELKLLYDAILYHVEKDNHLENLPKIHIDSALEKLIADGDITKDGQIITLSKDKVEEINNNIAEIEQLRSSVLEELQEKICKKLPDLNRSKIDIILENFEDFLATTFNRYGITLAKILIDKNSSNTSIKGLTGSAERYLAAMIQMVPEDKRQGLDRVFNDFLYNPTEKLANYLFTLAQSYILLQILNVDPDLKKIQKIAWNRKTIYLDTNVLIPLLFEGDEKNQSISLLIENTVKLGATIVVSETTVKEFTKKLLDFKSSHNTAVINRKLSFVKEVDHDDQMLKSYLVERGRYTGLTIENFCLKYENYPILLEKLGVKIEDNYSKSIEEHPLLEDIITKLKSISPHKTNITAFHDAYHILKIKELRKNTKSDEIGPAFWFLTDDHKLSKTEREIFGELDISSSIITEVWINLISNFLSPNITIEFSEKAFTKLLSSTFSSHKIKQDDLNNLMTVFMNDDKFTDAELRIIIGDKFAKDTLRQIKDVLDKGEELTPTIVKPLLDRVKDLLTDEFEKQRKEEKKLHETERKEDMIMQQQNVKALESKLDSLSNELGGLKISAFSAKQEYGKLKTTLIIVLVSGIIDAIAALSLSYLLPITTVLWILLGLLGAESIVTLSFLLKHHFKTKDKIKWNRNDKLAVLGILIGVVSLILTMMGLYYVFNPINS